MKPKIKELIEQCVENGSKRGYFAAHKYDESPTDEAIIERIVDCVMGEFYEWFDFE